MRPTKIPRIKLEGRRHIPDGIQTRRIKPPREVELEGHRQISDDIIVKIFLELPVTTLLRFRSVSKHWRSLIDDPYFVDMHRVRSYHRPSGVKLLVEQGGGILGLLMTLPNVKKRQLFVLIDEQGNLTAIPHPREDYKLSPTEHGEGVEGLICFDNIIWNPTTRKMVELPPQSLEGAGLPLYRGVNEHAIENSYHLGFDALSKQYKVLSITLMTIKGLGAGREYKYDGYPSRFKRTTKIHIQIITLGTNVWRDISNHIPKEEAARDIQMIGPAHLYLKNKIYFLVEYPTSLALVVFSVGEEKFKFLHLPEERFDVWRPWRMIEVRESIALMREDVKAGEDIWILTDFDRGEWERFSNPIHSPSMSMVFAINNTEVLVQDKMEGQILSCFYCDIKNQSFKAGPNLESKSAAYIYSKHVETLFNPTTCAVV